MGPGFSFELLLLKLVGVGMYYYLFIVAIGAERLVELVVSRRNTRWSIANGGREFGRGHYPVMVTTGTAVTGVSCIVEVAALHRPFIPWLGWPMLAIVAASTVAAVVVCRAAGTALEPAADRDPGKPTCPIAVPIRWLHHPNDTAGGRLRSPRCPLSIRHG